MKTPSSIVIVYENDGKGVLVLTKRIVSLILAVTMVMCLGISTFAAVQVVRSSAKLTFSGTTANCSADVIASGSYISATLSLYCGGSLVASWSDSGYDAVNPSGSATVVSGNTYTLIVSGTAGGAPFSSPPVTKTCP